MIPAEISSHFVGRCFNLPPIINPENEFIKVIKAIKTAGFKMRFPYKARVTPAEKASILVAIPTSRRHPVSMHSGFSFS